MRTPKTLLEAIENAMQEVIETKPDYQAPSQVIEKHVRDYLSQAFTSEFLKKGDRPEVVSILQKLFYRLVKKWQIT